MESIASLLKLGTAALSRAGIPEPRREAASLLEIALGRDRTFIIAYQEYGPHDDERSRYLEFINRRSNREPFHYIKGSKEFYGLDFLVSPAVLIPRPETEMLAERAIARLAEMDAPTFCEVGAGSGCISVTILVNVRLARGVGLEIADEAIEIALRNSKIHQTASRLDLRKSDLFGSLGDGEKFDLIVSNPPYVPAEEIAGLEPEVRDHEPRRALTDGADGLSIIRRIVAESPRFLEPGGTLMFEFGIGQADEVRAMFSPGMWESVLIESDFQTIPRMVTAMLRR